MVWVIVSKNFSWSVFFHIQEVKIKLKATLSFAILLVSKAMPTISIATSSQHFDQLAAMTVAHSIENAGKNNFEVSLALAGGSTPIGAYKTLVDNPKTYSIDWSRVRIFLSDERVVQPSHPDSNQYHVQPIFSRNRAQTFWPNTSLPTPAIVADTYEQVIFNQLNAINSVPQFDCILLGIGPDGHTASIFPQSKEIAHQSKRLVIPVTNSPKPPPNRISFSLRLINLAKQVIILATGEQKALVVRSVLLEEENSLAYPIAHVKPLAGSVHWILDQSAASHLPQSVLK